ncbi:kinase-like domain-containing protein [Ilyonectria robusta]|uniref:kinase-like domain-containing protein n=1 Tax=Ilyonectria robusta TaxID=1079257 RepID=UPI001E8EE3C2|nr:kinase-like domain-containing protein [Ilyonectria robusta]KAH8736020.1 kinase-like domain-containing protein [Ilyonectria robusta]
MAPPSPLGEHSSAEGVSAPEPSQKPADSSNTKHKMNDDDAGVRFSATVEITPAVSAATIVNEPSTDPAERDESSSFTEVAADQLQAFTKSLHGRSLQELRMNTCHFEAFSLPPSRVPSHEDESGPSTRLTTPTSAHFQSPHGSPRLSALASPPLTPAGSSQPGIDKVAKDGTSVPTVHEPPTITPQPSSSQDRPSPAPERRPTGQRTTSDHSIRRASSAEERNKSSHRRGMFGVGPGSVPASRDSSPSRSSASNFYSKPVTPGGDLNDPYAKGRRPPPPQAATKHSIDPRFVFSRKKKHSSPHTSKASLSDKRGSTFFGSVKGSTDDLTHGDSTASHGHPGPHGSMADLKRFFRKPGHSHHSKKRDSSPAPTVSGTKTPPSSRSTQQLPFGDDHGLSSRYGKLGKFLGSGAGGSVRLMKRKDDGTVFAVKEFRARHTYETEKEYNKKVTAEFCVGSTLHHGNIIETLDILQEKGRWYEVMEYAPFDLFAIVMTGKMSREEITCAFLQILNGVTYLHSVGLAHRDLKLDNVVVSGKGIMKIIDFGSAHVFKYPFETETVPAKGIVGSDPYLAPEVYDSKEYDAVAVDIWSLAIIFCCMTLRRFPWKLPRMTDNSFKLFAADPTPGHDPKKLIMPSKSTNDLTTTPARDFIPEDIGKDKHHHHEKHDRKEEGTANQPAPASAPQPAGTTSSGTTEKKETIKGPWRILRLLPRESRHIVSRMLEIDPKTRVRMDEILQEPWVADTVICQQFDHGEVIPAEDHTHTLEPPANQQPGHKA